MSAKRILCLGASKNIGYHVLEFLAPQPEKYTLFVLARSSPETITPFKGKENVTFIQGDGTDLNTVEKAIHSTMQGNVDFVIVTVGSSLAFNKFFMPRIVNPTLCGTVAKTLVRALKTVKSPPVVVAVSSTGILSTRNLLPLPLLPIYRVLLHKPHQDKIEMENVISQEYVPEKWVLVRGAAFTDGERTGKYRTGETEVGYTIRRTDVADFIVRDCIEGEGKWLGKRPVVVY